MSWCGPKDLQEIRLVCRVFASLLAQNQYIWRLSRANIQMGFPLPAAAHSEAQFTSYVFNGGICTVGTGVDPRRCLLLISFQVCSRHTTELPYSFALAIRICSVSYICISHLPNKA